MKTFKKIFTEILMLLLVVHISISFAQQQVEITVFKDTIEADFAGFKIYNDLTEVIATVSATTSPAVWTGILTTVNGKASITATAFDESGNESKHCPAYVYDPAPGEPAKITVKVVE